MKPVYTPLNKLTDKTKGYKVKVKVIQKAQPRESPQKNRYQRLILKDDQGNTMRGTLFNDAIESFEQAIERNGEYELSGATIQPVPVQHQAFPGEYQMNFNTRVKIKPINTGAISNVPQYIKLGSIMQNLAEEDELIDVLAIVLHIDNVRPIKRKNTDQQVRDITIVDDSVQRPMKLSAWNVYATVECERLNSWQEGFNVVGFTGIRIAHFKGISLATTISTTFVIDPSDEKAEELRVWALQNSKKLIDWRNKASTLIDESSQTHMTPLQDVEKKKANTTWQDEKFWIHATIPTFELKDLCCYIGCNKCGRRVNDDADSSFPCIYCNDSKAISTPRVSFSFYAVDDTGSIRLTAFTNEVETIFDTSCPDLHTMTKSGDTSIMEKTVKKVQHKKMMFQISPSNALTTSHVLKWIVRSVVTKEKNNEETPTPEDDLPDTSN